DELNNVLVGSVDLEPLLNRTAQVIEQNLKSEFVLFGLRETEYSDQRVIGTVQKKFDNSDIEEVRELTPHLKRAIIMTDELNEDARLKHQLLKYDISCMVRLTATPDKEIEGIGYLLF